MFKDMPATRVFEHMISERKLMGISSKVEIRLETGLSPEVDIDSNVSPVVLAASEVKGYCGASETGQDTFLLSRRRIPSIPE